MRLIVPRFTDLLRGQRRFACPECEHRSGVPIIYGYPNRSIMKQAKRDKIVWAGCVIEMNAPNRCCRNCGQRWTAAEVLGDHSEQ